jgi:cytidylate kinase
MAYFKNFWYIFILINKKGGVGLAVITISRQFGAGGRMLGQMLADHLDYLFLDDLIINEISKEAKVSKSTVIFTERSAGSTVSKIVTRLLSRDYMERLLGKDRGYMDEEVYVDVLHDIIVKFANQDNVVIMGRGGQYILRNFKNTFHLLLVADLKDRIKFLQRFHKLTNAKAKQAVMLGEKKRANLYRKFGKDDYNDSHLYHMVLNMSQVSLEKAFDLVCTLIKS